MAIDVTRRTSRRSLVTAAVGAAAGVAASAIAGAQPVAAGVGPNGNVQLGHGSADNWNDSAAETRVNCTTDGSSALAGYQLGSGIGIYGVTNSGRAVYGYANTTGIGVTGSAGSGNGVEATSGSGFAVRAASSEGTGVYGHLGSTPPPALTGAGAGVVARAGDTSKLALRVIGRATFSFSGKATVLTNHSKVTVTKTGVSASSLIIATPKTNRAGVFVQSAVPASGLFTIRLNMKVTGPTDIAYLILG